MKTSNLIIAIVFSTLVLLTSAHAQTQALATISFDFTVADQTLPAGVYGLTMAGSVLHIDRRDGSGGVFLLSYPAHSKQAAPGQIIFHRYGDRYFLSQAWIGDICHELAASNRERQYARTDKQEQVTVLASTTPAK